MGENNGHLSNYEKWRIYTDGLTSPDSYVDFGFYYMIAACLQRRVWLPPSHMPVFPNLYIVFIGPPGVGKGLVIGNVGRMLKFHKRINPHESKKVVPPTDTTPDSVVDASLVETLAHVNYGSEEPRSRHNQAKDHEKPLLFPIAADASTFEALVIAIASSLRHISHVKVDPITERKMQGIYSHSSICFTLSELSSLFRKKAEDVVRFLQITFDCEDYKKDTKTQGTDRIKNCCVSLLGAATQEFMVKLYKDDLANEGFASRTIFIYEPKDRKTAAFIPELNPLQLKCEKDLQDHILKLSTLYGQVSMPSDVRDFIEDWHRRAQIERPNLSDSLRYYYARKKIHLMKLSMAVHFAESTEMTVELSSVKKALSMLDGVETKMHYALINNTTNPYYRTSFKVVDYLRVNGKRSKRELYAALYEFLGTNEPDKALENILDYCLISNKITSLTENGKVYYAVTVRASSVTDSELTSS